jgi:hypothetical protein
MDGFNHIATNKKNNLFIEYQNILNRISEYKKQSDTQKADVLSQMLSVIIKDINNWKNAYDQKKVDADSFFQALISFDEYASEVFIMETHKCSNDF